MAFGSISMIAISRIEGMVTHRRVQSLYYTLCHRVKNSRLNIL